jgi:hypothetical protein
MSTANLRAWFKELYIQRTGEYNTIALGYGFS